jgi:mannan endo-1,4-beta-mannosidase
MTNTSTNSKRWLLLLTGLSVASFAFAQTATPELPADPKATRQTIALNSNLKKLAAKGFMFGHQDDLAYGVNWRYENGRSDVKEVAGDYPAVYGWELGGLEADEEKNLDGVPFKMMRQFRCLLLHGLPKLYLKQ